MQYFRPGSQLRQLITMLSIVGEYPIRSLYLLGNERAYKALVHKLTTPETFRIPQTETEMTTRLLTVTGKGNSRPVRFYKGALPILDWLHPDAYRYYMDAFWEHKFPGNAAHRDRNHRVAEAAAMCMRSGVECRPYMLPILQNRTITKRIPDAPCFYLAKELKKRKANRVFVAATFGLFTNGLKQFDEYYEQGLISKVLTTNVIYQTPDLLSRPYYINVDLSKYIALMIDKLNYDHSISELLDPETRSVEVLIECDNRDHRLQPYMYGTVQLTDAATEAMLVPTSAILQQEESCYVLVCEGANRFRKAEVTTASTDGDRTVVLSGVRPGEEIVTGGAFYLLDAR